MWAIYKSYPSLAPPAALNGKVSYTQVAPGALPSCLTYDSAEACCLHYLLNMRFIFSFGYFLMQMPSLKEMV